MPIFQWRQTDKGADIPVETDKCANIPVEMGKCADIPVVTDKCADILVEAPKPINLYPAGKQESSDSKLWHFNSKAPQHSTK